MAIFDIIDEVAQRQMLKTEMGDNRVFGVLIGIVVKNYDKDMPGRICVSLPARDEEANELKWARVAMPSGGDGWGHYFLPEVGDQVMVVFEQGNFEKPYIIGCIPKDNAKILRKSVDEKNKYKQIMTRNGTCIMFEDDGEIKGEDDTSSGGESGGDEPGAKDKIIIKTARDSLSFAMDNGKKAVTLSDKGGKNKIVLTTEEDKGKLSIKLEKKLEVKIGDGITLSMDGESGSVVLKAKKFNVEADSGIQLKTDGSAKLSGANVMFEANSTLKASSSGVTQIAGSPIKIG